MEPGTALAYGKPNSHYHVAWKHPFWWFAFASSMDLLLTILGAIYVDSFKELNPLALGMFEAGRFWFPVSVKLLSILGVYFVLVIVRQSSIGEAPFRKVILAYAFLFSAINTLSTLQILFG